MYHSTMVRRALRLGLVVTLAVLALSACDGEARHRAKPMLKRNPKPAPYQRTLKPCALANITRSSSSPRSPSGSPRVG
jgi:hypothetical protein